LIDATQQNRRAFGDRSVRGSTHPSPGARSMDLAHLVADVGYDRGEVILHGSPM
jgi:hypothetical protein